MTVDIAAVTRHQKRADFLQQSCGCGSPGRAGLVLGVEGWDGMDVVFSVFLCSCFKDSYSKLGISAYTLGVSYGSSRLCPPSGPFLAFLPLAAPALGTWLDSPPLCVVDGALAGSVSAVTVTGFT